MCFCCLCLYSVLYSIWVHCYGLRHKISEQKVNVNNSNSFIGWVIFMGFLHKIFYVYICVCVLCMLVINFWQFYIIFWMEFDLNTIVLFRRINRISSTFLFANHNRNSNTSGHKNRLIAALFFFSLSIFVSFFYYKNFFFFLTNKTNWNVSSRV